MIRARPLLANAMADGWAGRCPGLALKRQSGMASDRSFFDYVLEQLSGAGDIAWRKMFGEYAIFCDGKVVAFVCDNQLFVKPTAAGRAFLGSVVEGEPYPRAKPHFLMDEQLDDRLLLARLIRLTASELPMPVLKKASKTKAGT